MTEMVEKISSRVRAPILNAELCARNSGWFGPKGSKGQTRPVIPEIIKYPAATLRIEGNGDRNCPGTVPRRAFYLGVRQAARRPNLRLGRITRQRDLSGNPTNQELTHDKDTSRPVQDFLFWFLVSKEGGDYLRLTVARARLARAIHYEYRANKK